MRAFSKASLSSGRILPLGGGGGGPWFTGDVFVATDFSNYLVFDANGTLKDSVPAAGQPLMGGCAFDAGGNLWGTGVWTNTVFEWAAAPPHALLRSYTTNGAMGAGDTNNLTIQHDRSGDLWVGHAGGDADLHEYDPIGVLFRELDLPVESGGVTYFDLAADQCTLYYTSEGTSILRYNVCTRTPLPPFVTGLPPLDNTAYAVRLLSPRDGSGGVLLAAYTNILHFDAAGNLTGVYDAPGDNCWYGLALAADGTHFWATDPCFGTLTKFTINPSGGAPVLGPMSVTNVTLAACVKGDPPCTAGCNDGNACTDDSCDPVAGCIHDPTVTCDDANACTDDACNPITGCLHAPTNCDDEDDSCTVDTCDPVLGCLNTLVDCNDNNACTTDFCSPGCAGCRHVLPDIEVNQSVRITRSGGTTSITWTDSPGPFNVYRGTRSGSWSYNQVCLASSVAAPPVIDTSPPAAGLAFYVVTRRSSCGESIPGRDSSDAPEPNPHPCP